MLWLGNKGRALINILLALIIMLFYIMVITPAANTAVSILYKAPIYRGRAKSVIAIECAVDWNAAAMPEILDILKQKDVRVTFFVSGKWAAENDVLLKRIVSEGHELGTMGYYTMNSIEGETLELDIKSSLEIINRYAGVMPKLYYSGNRDIKASSKAANNLGLTHVLCTVDLLSARGDATDMIERALEKPIDGSILLIQPTAAALKALPVCIDALKQKGYTISTVSNAIGENIEKEYRV